MCIRDRFYYNLAFSQKLLKLWHEAVANFQKVLELQPQIKEAYNELGQIYLHMGQSAKARQYWQKALEMDHSFSEAAARLADSYRSENRQLAREELEKVTRNFENEPLGWYYLGEVYFEAANFPGAWKAAMKAKELAPASDEARVLLGKLSLAEKQDGNARIYFEKAALLNPYNVAALIGVADIDSRNGNYEKAQSYYQRIMEIDPQNFDAHHNYAEMLYRQGRMAEALDEFRQAVILNPDSAEVSCNLGIVLKDCLLYTSPSPRD